MPKKVAKKSGASTSVDFSMFMKNMQKDGLFINRIEREDKFYRFGEYNIDRALRGGLPTGQIYAFQGPSGSGKSLAALCVARSVINEGKRVMYLDAEKKIARHAIEMLGLGQYMGTGDFNHIEPEGTLEDTLDVLMRALESDFFGLLVLDTVDALTTDEQEERDIHEGSKVGGYKAKVLSEWMGKVSSLAAAHDCSVIFVRQLRDNPNAMYGSPETTSGGRALEYYATAVLRFGPNKQGNSEEDGKIAYQGVKVSILKHNQGAIPKNPIESRFYIGENHEWGFDKIKPLLDEAIRLRVWAPATATSHKYLPCAALCEELGATETELAVNGRNNLMSMLENDPSILVALEKVVEAQSGVPVEDDIRDGDGDGGVDGFEELGEE